MKFIELTYPNNDRVLVNQFAVSRILETEIYGKLASIIEFTGSQKQFIVQESLDEIQLQMDDKDDISVTLKR